MKRVIRGYISQPYDGPSIKNGKGFYFFSMFSLNKKPRRDCRIPIKVTIETRKPRRAK